MSSPNRRQFLSEATAAGLGLTASLGALTGRAAAANDKIGVACVGVRGQGGALLRTFAAQQEWPDTMMVTYDYPGKILTYEMRIWSKPRFHEITEGAAVYGDEGWMLISNSGWKAFDAKGKLIKEAGGRNPLHLHVRNFLDAVRSRKREALNQEIAQGYVSSVMCHAGNIAWRTGKKLKLDAKTETFDDPEANKLLGRERRKGFELPNLG